MTARSIKRTRTPTRRAHGPKSRTTPSRRSSARASRGGRGSSTTRGRTSSAAASHRGCVITCTASGRRSGARIGPTQRRGSSHQRGRIPSCGRGDFGPEASREIDDAIKVLRGTIEIAITDFSNAINPHGALDMSRLETIQNMSTTH
ncbi:hypothetical protein ALQ71_101883 [Pseudomonas coronafaciens pv. striafaciens]|nr:hypothetical protein ALQ71_101883 [Pseudomonas coronafaciens pv. striafaciens]